MDDETQRLIAAYQQASLGHDRDRTHLEAMVNLLQRSMLARDAEIQALRDTVDALRYECRVLRTLLHTKGESHVHQR